MDTSYLVGVAVVLVIVALLALWFGRGWARQRARRAHLPALATPPADLGAPDLVDDGFYVATTAQDAPTDRIAVPGLAFRARAVVSVSDAGVVLDLAGSPAAFIPREALVGVGRATWTIDRVVGRDGLVMLRWRLGNEVVDTYLRPADRDALTAALARISPSTEEAA